METHKRGTLRLSLIITITMNTATATVAAIGRPEVDPRKRRSDEMYEVADTGATEGYHREGDHTIKSFEKPRNAAKTNGDWANIQEGHGQFLGLLGQIPEVLPVGTVEIVSEADRLAALKDAAIRAILAHPIWEEIRQKIAGATMADAESQLQILPMAQRTNPFQELGYSASFMSLCRRIRQYNRVERELSAHVAAYGAVLGQLAFGGF